MITRQIGKILRGRATPAQIMMAAVLGSMLGFVPGWWEGPGLIIALVLLLIMLNANLAVAAIAGLLAKAVSYALLPVSFAAGQFLLDGPTQPLFRWAINAPVLALFGFEHYLTTGAVAVGLIFGIICGLAVNQIVTRFRQKMAIVEANSDLFQRYSSKRWVKFLTFIFVGGNKGKRTYAELLEKKFGNPVRILGVIFAALVIAFIFVFQSLLSGPILTASLHSGLERLNGATVDLGEADVDLKTGRLVVRQLAMADPNALDTDILRASTLEAQINTTNLLRKRAHIDRVIVSEAVSGAKRAVRGVRIGPPPQPEPPPPGEGKTIEDYIADAKVWQERLGQIRDWLEKLSGSDAEEDQSPEQKQETLKQRIKRQIRESGYASVKASHLIEDSPTLVVSQLTAEGVKSEKIQGEVFDVQAENLSTHPRLWAEAPRISVRARSKNIIAVARLREAAAASNDGDSNRVRFTYKGLPVDTISKSLAVAGNASPISGGTVDLDIRGNWTAAGVGNLDLPLNITLHDSTIALPQVGSSAVKELKLIAALRGPMENPRIVIDDQQLADALATAGATALSNHVRAEADKALNKTRSKIERSVTDKVSEKLDSNVGDKAKDVLGNLLPPK